MAGQGYIPRPDGIDILLVSTKFDKSLEVSPDIDVANYVEAFQELAKFFDLMGALFASMASDIRDQVKILEKFLNSSEKAHYQTIQAMVDYEKANPEERLEPKRKDPSGSRTVLHLDRTIDFFIQFLTKVNDLGDEEKLPPPCSAAYQVTLGKHHSWLLSKAAGLAIKTLPNKVQLFEKVSKYPYAQTAEYQRNMVTAMQGVHTKTEQIFTTNNLMSLPF